jgi:hypothetical protein
MQEEVPKPLLTDAVDTTPIQGKLRCITLIFDNHHIYMCVVHLHCRNFMVIIKNKCYAPELALDRHE